MVNQICIACVVQGLAEGVSFAKQARTHKKVVEVISKGVAQTWQIENSYATMIQGKFDLGFAVDWSVRISRFASTRRDASRRYQFYSEIQRHGWTPSGCILRRLAPHHSIAIALFSVT
jgi:hypothetical protein